MSQIDIVDPTRPDRVPRDGVDVPDTGSEPPDFSIGFVTTRVLNPERFEILNEGIRWGCDWVEEAQQQLSEDARALVSAITDR